MSSSCLQRIPDEIPIRFSCLCRSRRRRLRPPRQRRLRMRLRRLRRGFAKSMARRWWRTTPAWIRRRQRAWQGRHLKVSPITGLTSRSHKLLASNRPATHLGVFIYLYGFPSFENLFSSVLWNSLELTLQLKPKCTCGQCQRRWVSVKFEFHTA